MRRFAVGVAIGMGAFLGLAAPAQAGLAYCKVDPVIMLDGTVVDVTAGIPFKYVPLVNGPVQYEIAVPESVDRQLILNDLGYNGHGSIVTFVDTDAEVENGAIPTSMRVHVPIDTTRLAPGEVVPAELSITVDDLTLISVQGTTELTGTDVAVEGLLASLLDD